MQIKSCKELFNCHLFALIICLENIIQLLSLILLKFLEVLLHFLLLRTKRQFFCFQQRRKLLLLTIALIYQILIRNLIIIFSLFFDKLRVLFIFIFILKANSFKFQADAIDSMLPNIKINRLFRFTSSKHDYQIGQLRVLNDF